MQQLEIEQAQERSFIIFLEGIETPQQFSGKLMALTSTVEINIENNSRTDEVRLN